LKTITDLLIQLTPQSIAILCDSFENGTLSKIFYEYLLPMDKRNRPEVYKKLENSNEKELNNEG